MANLAPFALAAQRAEVATLAEARGSRLDAVAARGAAAAAIGLLDLAVDDALDTDDARELFAAKAMQARLIGGFSVAIGSRELVSESWPNRRAATMLRVLTLHAPRPLHRSELVNWLWAGEAARGERSFRAAVSVIRRNAELVGAPRSVLARSGDRYWLDPPPATDVALFEHHLDRATLAWRARRRRVAFARIALALAPWEHGAVLLPGDLDAPWTIAARQRLSARVALARSLAAQFSGDPRQQPLRPS